MNLHLILLESSDAGIVSEFALDAINYTLHIETSDNGTTWFYNTTLDNKAALSVTVSLLVYLFAEV
jgi:hypothetical protein